MKTLKGIFLVIGLCILTGIFGGCSNASKAKSENEIKADFEVQLQECGLPEEQGKIILNHFEIIQRQTDNDNKTDTIWVNAAFSNDVVQTTNATVIITYELFNDGWNFSNAEYESSPNFSPISSNITTEDVAERLITEGYTNFEFVNRSENPEANKEDVFYYQYEENLGSIKNIYGITVRYVFENYFWAFDTINENLIDSTINENEVLGIWKHEDSSSNLYVNVIAIDLNSMTIDLEYDFENYARHAWYDETYNSKSNGVQTYNLGYYDDTTISIHLKEMDQDFIGSLYYVTEETDRWEGCDMGKGFLLSAGTGGARWLNHE